MKFRSIAVIVLFGIFLSSCNQSPNLGGSSKMKNDLDSVSYAIGANIAKMLKDRDKVDEINYNTFVKGMKDVFEDNEMTLNDSVRRATISSYMRNLQNKVAQENLQKGQEFLEENKKKEGVKETESGLQYKVIKEGSGISPEPQDTVKVHYTGENINGEIFDSSVDRGKPAEFPLNRVIKGWTEGLQLMKEGAKYKFYIPSEIAYGKRPPRRGSIEPNETLIFEVELLEVKPAK
jgi:FKBP-type peptidyl-prolyl cis-trans isomerase